MRFGNLGPIPTSEQRKQGRRCSSSIQLECRHHFPVKLQPTQIWEDFFALKEYSGTHPGPHILFMMYSHVRTLRLLFCSLLFCLSASAFKAQQSPSPDTPPNAQVASIDAVIGQVKQALAGVQTTLSNNNLPPLKQVKLSLQTVATKKVGGSLKLWVISIGSSYEKDKTQQIDLVLTPPKPGNSTPVGTATLTQELQDAIVNAAMGVKNAGSGSVPLNLSSLDVQLSFAVKGDVNGGANVTILPITLDFSGDLAHTAVQTLTVSFATR